MDGKQKDYIIRQQFIQRRRTFSNLNNEILKDYFDIQSRNIFQNQEFLKHISLISVAILSLSGLFIGKAIILKYFIAGVFLHLLIIFLVLSYLRETLDIKINSLQEEKDDCANIVRDQINLIDRYLEKEKLTEKIYEEYLSNPIFTNDSKKIEKKVLGKEKQRKDKQSQPLNYFKEFIIFLFVAASLLIFISLIEFDLNIWVIILTILFLLILSFSSPSLFIVKNLDMFFKRIRQIFKFLKKFKRRT